MSQYHYSIEFLNADIGWTGADKFFKKLGAYITVPDNLDQEKNYLTADRFEFTEFVISNQVNAEVYVNGNLNVRAKVVVPAEAKVNLTLDFHNGDSQIVLLDKATLYVAKPTWREHIIKEMNSRCLQDQNCKQRMSYIIDSIIFARSATIIKNSANGLKLANSLNLAVEVPEGIFDISTILSFAYGNSAIKHNEINITFNEKPGVVAFRCLEIEWKRKKIFSPIFIINSMQGKMEEHEMGTKKSEKWEQEQESEKWEHEQKPEEEIEVVEGFAPISYGGDCIGFEDRIKYNIM